MTLDDANNVVIHREAALGDVIWVTSILSNIRSRNSKAKISISTIYPDVFTGNPYVDEILVNGYKDLYNDKDSYIIDLDRSYESNRLVHMVDAYKSTAGLSGEMPDPSLYLLDYSTYNDAVAKHSYKCKTSVCIHMAATSPDRIVSEHVWRDVISSVMNDADNGVIIVGANRDYGSGDWGCMYDESRYMSFVGASNLKQTAAIIDKCDAFVGVDSGMSHVAFAVGTKSAIIYSMVSPEYRMPRHTKCVPITASRSSIGCLFCVDGMPADVSPLCGRSLNKSECITSITSDSIVASLDEALES